MRLSWVTRLAAAIALAVLPWCTPSLLARLVICEIHYHPAGTADDRARLEFVEIYNDEPLPFDLSGYRIEGGISYAFPLDTVIEGLSVVVVASDPEALAAAHGIQAPAGPWEGRLDNGGDSVLLIDAGGSTVGRVRYDDRGRWPAAADGAGPSLVLRDPLLETDEGEHWGWSAAIGGTPGVVSFETVRPAVVFNEVSRDGAGGGWIELFNPAAEPFSLRGHRLLGESRAPILDFADEAVVPASGFLALDESALALPLSVTDQQIVLVNSDGLVADAIRLGEASDGATDGRSPDGGDRWFRLTSATRGASNATPPATSLVISEIHYHPLSGDEREEFIEIVNIGDGPIDLGGFSLTSGVRYDFADGESIAPGEHLVVARDPARLAELHGLERVLGPWEGVLRNSGEMVRLRDRLRNPVDEVRYHDEDTWSRWADGHGPSLELVDLRQDNSFGRSWVESEHVAEWATYEYTGRQRSGDSEFHLYLIGAGETLIDSIEIVPVNGGPNHLPGGDFDGENPLAGWVMDGTHIETRLEAGGGVDGTNALRIVATGRGDSRVNRIERQTTPSLRPGAEYTVRFAARWIRGSRRLMTRSWNHGIARVSELDVPAVGGTPGKPSSGALENTGPLIGAIEQSPALPAADQPVTIRARVNDPDGVAAVTLHFRVDGESEFSTLPMDPAGHGGLRAAVIDGIGSRSAVVELFIEARDALGAVRVEPPGAPDETLVYQYDDGVAETAVPSYRIVLRQREFTELRRRSVFSNALLPGTFIRGGERIFHDVGVRYRGSPFLRRDSVTGTRKGFRVRLGDEAPLIESVRLTLDEQAADPTTQVDRFVRHLLQRAGGVPYGERRHIRLILRGVPFPRAYEEVLHVDQRYLERSFGDSDGELYKIDAHYEIDDRGGFPDPAFTSWRFTEDRETLRFTYKKRSREEEDDYSSLMSLLEVMDVRRTSNEEFDAAIGGLINVDEWIKSIAVYRAVEDWDCIGGWTGKNVYLYRPSGDDARWTLIPWDHDVALGSATLQADQNPRAYLYTPYYAEISRLLRRPAFDRRFLAELERMMAEDYDARIAGPVFDATFQFLQQHAGAQSPARLKVFINTRRAFILSQLRGPTELTIDTNAGEPLAVDEPEVALSGKAPFRIATLVVDGAAEASAPRFVDKETWNGRVTVAPGEQTVSLLGFDAEGALDSIASISITLRGGAPTFLRGDANLDDDVNLSDAISILVHLFQAGELRCADAADVNDSGDLNITDPIFLLDYLFKAGKQPPAPFGAPGVDPTPDGLDCVSGM